MNAAIPSLVPSIDVRATLDRLTRSIEAIVRGKPGAVRLALTTLLARGHLLIEDVPGVGKTTLAQAIARSIGASFQRIQFTSDLLPSDVLGVSIWDAKTGTFELKPGPIFANLVLADEINRTTPKTQSCLLEAMSEAQVSIDRVTHALPLPFFVIATQNPEEHHGTYPLPESQLDRFLVRMALGYPNAETERALLASEGAERALAAAQPVISPQELLALQSAAEKVRVDPAIADYLLAIVHATRGSPHIELGASTRGALMLHRAAKALALLDGRSSCIPDDVKTLVGPVLAHRVILAQPPGRRGREIAEARLAELADSIPVPV